MIKVFKVTKSLISQGDFKFFWNVFKRKIYSTEMAFGFKLDLEHGLKARKALIPFTIREFRDNKTTGLIEKLKTCYVAVNKEEIPCFRCWLIDSSQNDKLKQFWGNTFPELAKDEMLIENVFTNPKFRGLGIFPAALYQISDLGWKLGANYTTRSMAYAGFKPYVYREVKWILFKKRVIFSPIPDNLLQVYNETTKGIPK